MHNFQYTRNLEKQVTELQAALLRCLTEIREKDKNITSSEKNLEIVTDERDSWKDKACELQLN